uniref:Uncharacterized protein n=1 Tax=Setaria viridis TaxID=4556 RepID=A0A4U6UGZ9_SETVI|nr:hypothetical protein SEVIR_5G226200v2 [Setaria viridis]
MEGVGGNGFKGQGVRKNSAGRLALNCKITPSLTLSIGLASCGLDSEFLRLYGADGFQKKVIAASHLQLPEGLWSVDSRTLDDNRIVLVLCILRDCGGDNCYCCVNQKPEELCFATRQQCMSKCSICNPRCPPRRAILPVGNERLY